jgi:hypothetical protein
MSPSTIIVGLVLLALMFAALMGVAMGIAFAAVWIYRYLGAIASDFQAAVRRAGAGRPRGRGVSAIPPAGLSTAADVEALKARLRAH